MHICDDYLPTARGGTKIDQYFRIGQKVEFLIELNQLERGTRAIAILFGHMIERKKKLRDNKIAKKTLNDFGLDESHLHRKKNCPLIMKVRYVQ